MCQVAVNSGQMQYSLNVYKCRTSIQKIVWRRSTFFPKHLILFAMRFLVFSAIKFSSRLCSESCVENILCSNSLSSCCAPQAEGAAGHLKHWSLLWSFGRALLSILRCCSFGAFTRWPLAINFRWTIDLSENVWAQFGLRSADLALGRLDGGDGSRT